MKDREIQKWIDDNMTYPDGTPMCDKVTFYEGAKWYREHHRQQDPNPINKPCELCGEITDNLGANPANWGIEFEYEDGNGGSRTYHRKCVVNAISNQSDHRQQLEEIRWTDADMIEFVKFYMENNLILLAKKAQLTAEDAEYYAKEFNEQLDAEIREGKTNVSRFDYLLSFRLQLKMGLESLDRLKMENPELVYDPRKLPRLWDEEELKEKLTEIKDEFPAEYMVNPWDKVRRMINDLEDAEAESRAENLYEGDGNFADNH